MDKISTSEGYRWRNELVKKLLPYVKDENEAHKLGFPNERELLNNIVRGYVPIYFDPKIRDEKPGTWIVPYSLGLDRWWMKEIEDIGKEFAEISDRLDDGEAKKILQKRHWDVKNTHVEGISTTDKRGRWRYDAIKEKIAVEVELSNRSQMFKDIFKFLIGQAMGQINVGIIMVRQRPEKPYQPYFGNINPNSHPLFTTLPMLKVAFHGFPNKLSE